MDTQPHMKLTDSLTFLPFPEIPDTECLAALLKHSIFIELFCGKTTTTKSLQAFRVFLCNEVRTGEQVESAVCLNHA